MEDLVDKGLVKAIGISNFTVKKTAHLLEGARIVPACNQGTLQYVILRYIILRYIVSCHVKVS